MDVMLGFSTYLWSDLEARFSVVNGPRVQQLKRDLAECKQKNLSVMEYYGKMKKLWDDLADLERFPVCTSRNCTCDLQEKLAQMREREHSHQFLMGLNDVLYGTLRSNLLAQETIPPVVRIYNILVQDETSRNGMHKGESKEAGASLFAVKKKMEVKELVCSHCGKGGNDVEACYKLIGYPEGWIFRDQAGRGRGNNCWRGNFRGPGRGAGRSTVYAGRSTVTGGQSETPREDALRSNSTTSYFEDAEELSTEDHLDRSWRNGGPPENGDAEELQTVDLEDRTDDHGRPSEGQNDGPSGEESTVDRVMEDGRPSSSGDRCRYPLSSYVTYEKFSHIHKCFLMALDEEVEPTNFKKAFQDEQWRKAMREEIDAQKANGMWLMVAPPRRKKPLGCKWVYKIKRKSGGSVERKVGILECAKDLWNKLNELYTETSLLTKIFLLEKFFKFRLDMSKDIEENLDVFTKLISDIKLIGDKHIDDYTPIALLNAIPDFYSDVKSAIKYGRDNISLDVVVNSLKSKELELKNSKSDKNSGEVMHVRGGTLNKFPNHKHANNDNSNVRKFNQGRGKSRSKSKTRKCYNCNEYGHLSNSRSEPKKI
ncbi:unnamed protein product [Cuscuta campestris]|uniref:Retrotransposon gag domain-containing protein n=1 Tax=Cuscuta campestris TaxID=132261 RepID=A0A484L3M8_9ASTE|nr:unnamed protein product [Cuscuta campestris]